MGSQAVSLLVSSLLFDTLGWHPKTFLLCFNPHFIVSLCYCGLFGSVSARFHCFGVLAFAVRPVPLQQRIPDFFSSTACRNSPWGLKLKHQRDRSVGVRQKAALRVITLVCMSGVYVSLHRYVIPIDLSC
jgi:hypothetical protein